MRALFSHVWAEVVRVSEVPGDVMYVENPSLVDVRILAISPHLLRPAPVQWSLT